MDIKLLSQPLSANEVEFRVQSINKGGYATILVYKNARADQQRLDDVVGPLGWKREHSNNNHNCTVSIWCEEKKQWVSKEDTGTESMADKEKGLASDSFKRACFNWGIGRELYAYPYISVKLKPSEVDLSKQPPKATWNLKLKEWRWLTQFTDGKISFIAARDETGAMRYKWGEHKKDENK